MTDDIVIYVENLSKMYRVYDRPVDRLKQMVCGSLSRTGYGREFWALRSTSLKIKRGETVGIIGRNGSGKSTLLQMLAAGLTPTTGEVKIKGRIAALLELGSGFNPDFTGRENIYLNASILGISRELIEARINDILVFADIGDFINQPVRTYSSGMVVRLAFAVAIHVDADILIVDEALSVGDDAFCRKCYGKIRSFQEAGGTILFVTHSTGTIVDLCQRAILLDHGELLGIGLPKIITAWYQKIGNATPDRLPALKDQIKNADLWGELTLDVNADPIENLIPTHKNKIVPRSYFEEGLKSTSTLAYESRGADILDPHIRNCDGNRVNCLVYGEAYTYSYRVTFRAPASRVRFGMLFKTITGFELAGAATNHIGADLRNFAAGTTVEIQFHWKCLLTPGPYFANAGVVAFIGDEEIYLARILDAVAFRVQPEPSLLVSGPVGLIESSSTTLI